MRKNQIIIIGGALVVVGFFIGLILIFTSSLPVRAQELDFTTEPPFDSLDSTASNPVTSSTLSVADITADSVSLSWTKNPDPDFAYYLVLRITSLVPPAGTVIAQITDRNRNYFTDTLPQGTTYYYQIRTYNQAGQFIRSNTLGALYVPYRHIATDGSIADWSGQAPSIQDYLNDKEAGSPSGTDISNIYLAYDENYFYSRMDLNDASPNTQDTVYYSVNFDALQDHHSIDDKYLRSQFFPGPEQNQSVLRQRTSIDPHQAITIVVDIAARGTNTLEMRTPLNKLNGGLLYFYVKASTAPGAIGYYDGTIQLAMKIPRIYPDKAVSLAKDVLGAPYLGDGKTWGGKGYDCKVSKFTSPFEILNGYYYYDNRPEIRNCSSVIDKKDKGVDCSGLTMWSYNRAYFEDKKIGWGKCLDKECPITYEKTSNQCGDGNSIGISKGDLRAGDLLCFDENNDGIIDHVAMYVGGDVNNVVHASLFAGKITYATYDPITEKVTTIKPTGESYPIKVKSYRRVKDPKIGFKSTVTSPVDLVITDPEGLVTTRENPWGYPMEYQVYDINDDGKLDDIVISGQRKIGDYLIQVVSEPDALPTDTYTLHTEALINGQTVINILAENVLISDIPRVPYIIKSTETEIIPIVPAFIDIQPDTLNLKSKGQYITAYIELPKGYGINSVDLQSIRLNNQIPIESKPITIDDYDKNGIPDLMVKFDRKSVQSILFPGDNIKITISGKLNDGRLLEGSDKIKVIDASSAAFLFLLALCGVVGGVQAGLFGKDRARTVLVISLIILSAIAIVIYFLFLKEVKVNEREIGFIQNGNLWVLNKDLTRYKIIDTEEDITDFSFFLDGKTIYWVNKKGGGWKQNEVDEVAPLVSVNDMERDILKIEKDGDDLKIGDITYSGVKLEDLIPAEHRNEVEITKEGISYLKGRVQKIYLSPDGKYIAYETSEESIGCCGAIFTGFAPWLRIMRNDGTGKVKIERPEGEQHRNLMHFQQWFPDSQKILFYFRTPDEATQHSLFYEVEIDGKNPKVYAEIFKFFKEDVEVKVEDLTAEDIALLVAGVGLEPVYSPTDEQIAYIAEWNKVRLKDIKTKESKTILESEYLPFGPASRNLIWSKDGSFLIVREVNKISIFNKKGDIVLIKEFGEINPDHPGLALVDSALISPDNKYLVWTKESAGLIFLENIITGEKKEFKVPKLASLEEKAYQIIASIFFSKNSNLYYLIKSYSTKEGIAEIGELWSIDTHDWNSYKIADNVSRVKRVQ